MTNQPKTVSRPRRSVLRILPALGLLMAVAVTAVFAAPPLLRIPGPATLAYLLSSPPSRQGELFDSRPVPASPNPRPFPVAQSALPAEVPWKGSRVPVAEVLTTTGTNSFLVVRDGKLIHEWYRPGVEVDTKQSSWSAAKSVVSLLVGRAINAGTLGEDDRLVDILPELATGSEYDTITIRHLLDMTSGVDVSENYNPYWPLTGTARMYLTEDLAGFIRSHRDLQFPPGSSGEYRSVDTQLLGMALARVEGKPLADVLAQQIWDPIGAEYDATWNLDRAGGQEKAFCCLNATARDFAKMGQLVLDGGRVGATQVIPSAWIDRISIPAPLPVIDWGYSAQWWHPAGAEPDLMALGVYGQYIYIDPPSRTVIVKLSDHGTTQDEAETVAVFRAIVAG